MSPDVKKEAPKELQPLRDVADEARERKEALQEVARETGKELSVLESELEAEMKLDLLLRAIPKTNKNIKQYALALGSIPEQDRILEETVYTELVAAIIAAGGTEEDLPLFSGMLGLKPFASAEELFNLDEKANQDKAEDKQEKDDYALDEDEIRPESYDAKYDPETGLDSHVMSVLREYSDEIQGLSSPEELKGFLMTKWHEVALPLLRQKYVKGVEQSSHSQAFSAPSAGEKSQLEGLLSTEVAEQTELDKFYNAISAVGGSVNDTVFLNAATGEVDGTSATEAMATQIDMICDSIAPEDFGKYKMAVIPPEAGTPAAEEKIATLLEAVPKNFRGSEFEKDYEVYLEKSLKDKKYPKGFHEWLSERPKPTGIGGVLDKIKLLFTQAGLGKMLRQFLGKDSWLAGMLGLGEEETDEDKADDENFKDQDKYTNPRAWAHVKDNEVVKTIQEHEKWSEVSIQNVTKESISTTSDLDTIKAVLNAAAGSALAVARTKGLTITSLATLNSLDEKAIPATDGESFTVEGDPKKQEFLFTNASIEEAKALSPEIEDEDTTSDLETLLGDKKYSDKFNLEKDFPDTAFTSSGDKRFATLQPALQSLLTLEDGLWGEFKITDKNLEKFLDIMGGTGDGWYTKYFRNEDDAFYKNEDGTFSAKTGAFNNWGGNPKYASVKALFEKLI